MKLAVGIDSIDHLRTVHHHRIAERIANGGEAYGYHVTRNFPKRAEELLDGGSLYWVIRGKISARQTIVRLDPVVDDRDRPACRIVLEKQHIMVEPRSFRAFQGWRYFKAADAPTDLLDCGQPSKTLPDELRHHLRDIGFEP